MEHQTTRLLIAGGGTGGHLFPGLAVAQLLHSREPAAEILFVGTTRGIESRVIPQTQWPLETIEISGLKTVGMIRALRGLSRVPGSILQSRGIIRRFRPSVVLGVGGYASGPVALAARLHGLPTAILEQNSIPGLTNRILGNVVDRVFLSLRGSETFFHRKNTILVGNPVRPELIAAMQKKAPAKPSGSFRVLVFGGSQGAHGVNELCSNALIAVQERGLTVSIVHQTGTADETTIQERYDAAGMKAECHAFIDDMATEYDQADLIICRAGATSIAELGIVGKPAILIPYPFAANDHQRRNAEEMVQNQAALLFEEDDTTPKTLAGAIADLALDPDKQQSMACAMGALGRPEAGDRIVDWVQKAGRPG